MKSLQEIQSILSAQKPFLRQRYPIAELGIFGSYARNEQTADSDLDILIEFNGEIGIRFVDLAEELEDLVGLNVDLVSRNGLRDQYYQAIKSELLYV